MPGGDVRYNWNWGIFFQPAADGSGTWLTYLLVGVVWTLAPRSPRGSSPSGSARSSASCARRQAGGRSGSATPMSSCSATSRSSSRCSSGSSCCRSSCRMAIGGGIKQMPPPWAAYVPAVLCLGFYTAARVAEQVRAGIQSLPRGQQMAGTAMGSPSRRPTATWLLPQAYRIVLPAAHERVPQHHQEQLGRADDRPARDHRPGAVDAGVHLPGVRGVHRGDDPVPPGSTSSSSVGMRWVERKVSVPGLISAGGPPLAGH